MTGRQPLEQPYLGLRPFDEEDEPLFFGREAHVDAALTRLEDHAFLAVVGASGCGKSSLVKAGMLPVVRQGFLLGHRDWTIIKMRPGYEPYQRLARELAPVLAGAAGAGDGRTIVSALRRSEDGLLTLLGTSSRRVLLLVDQFEELFAFRRATEPADRVVERDEAGAFVRLLLTSCANPDTAVRVVITMRSDFMGECDVFLGLPEAISQSQFLVPRLDRSQMEEAIVRPATVSGAAFAPFTFAYGLVTRIVNDAGDRPDQLPLMQHALMRSWKHAVRRRSSGPIEISHADYEQAGEIQRALSRDADAGWATIARDERLALVAKPIFLLLCDVSPEGKITRRRPRIGELRSATGATAEDIARILQVFQQDDRNFLLPPVDTNAPPGAVAVDLTDDVRLDISHESLIRQWEMFNGWVADEASSAKRLVRLRDDAHAWSGGAKGLIGDPELSVVLKWWRETDKPTNEWAARYGGGLAEVIEYLTASEKARDDEADAAEQRREQELADANRRASEEAERARYQEERALAQEQLAREQTERALAQEQRAFVQEELVRTQMDLAAEEAANARRFRTLSKVFGALLVIAVVLGVLVYVQWQARKDLLISVEALRQQRQTVEDQLGRLNDTIEDQQKEFNQNATNLGRQAEEQKRQAEEQTRQAENLRENLRKLEEERQRVALGASLQAKQLTEQQGLFQEEIQRLAGQSEAMAEVVKARGALTETLQGYEMAFGENAEPDAVLPVLVRLSRPVVKLDLSRTRVSSGALAMLAGLRDLAVLDLSQTDLGDDAVDAVLKLPAIRELNLDGTAITTTTLDRLAGTSVLTRVNVSRTRILPGAVVQLRSKRPNLDVAYVGDPMLEVLAQPRGSWDDVIKALGTGNRRSGQAITLSHRNLTDAALAALSDFTDITLINCLSITDEGMRRLARHRTLRRLALQKLDVSAAGLDHLAAIKSLDELSLQGQLLRTREMLALGKLTSVKRLTIVQPLQEITDEGLKGLAALTQLERLSLRSLVGDITDTSLRIIAGMKGLQGLTLEAGPRVTKNGYAALSGLPALRDLEIGDQRRLDVDDLQGLGELKQLTSLRISGRSTLTESSVAVLQKQLTAAAINVDFDRPDRPPSPRFFFSRSSQELTFLRGLRPPDDRVLPIGQTLPGVLSDRRNARTPDGDMVQAWRLGECSGRNVQIDLKSRAFDALLTVVGPEENEVWDNDDFGASFDSQLNFPCRKGPYTVIVGAIDEPEGAFTLSASVPEPQRAEK